MRDLLKTVMTGWGFDVIAARSAEEAWRMTEEKPVDIAVLDLNLPGEGGIELLGRLRTRFPQLQAVVLTGFASVDAARAAIHLDVVEFLTKPCHLGELEKALDRAMRRLAPPEPARPMDLPATGAADNSGKTLEEVEREHILAALTRNNSNRTATAAELGISRRTLYYKLEEYERQGFEVD
jgi:DNA-binding NtrC family response regulator